MSHDVLARLLTVGLSKLSGLQMFERICCYAQLIRLDKPVGTLLLLWPTLWGLWVAGEGLPSAKNVTVFVAGVFIMRSAGCIINDVADRDIDPLVVRTSQRPIASGKVSLKGALGLFSALCLLAFILVLNLNLKAILFSFVGLALAVCYPFMKRITHLPQLFLAVAFSWGIPMAFAAQIDKTPLICWLLMVVNLFWVVAYDTMYAMADKADDLKIGVRSTAILFGDYDRLIILTCQLIVLISLYFCGQLLDLNRFFYFFLVLGSLFFIFQAWLYFTREPGQCLRAFLNNAWFGACVFSGFVLAYLPL